MQEKWCVCISMSDLSPSTKRCNKQDCRNQVVQFLTNPFLANFQNGHSPPLYLVGFADCDPRGKPMPPCIGGHGFIHGQKCQIQEKWCVGCMSQDVQNDWLVPMFWCVCISMSDQSPSTKRCNKQDFRNQVVQFLTNPFLANFQNGHSPPLYFGWICRL